MSQGFFTAISGIQASQTAMDVISDNISNINTAGFKESDVTFNMFFGNSFRWFGTSIQYWRWKSASNRSRNYYR